MVHTLRFGKSTKVAHGRTRVKNKLKINDSKTEFLVLTPSFFKHQFKDLQINVKASACNLGVIFDSHLNLESQ